jgi:hypothetical protein
MIYGLESLFNELQCDQKETDALLLNVERAQVDSKCLVIKVETPSQAVDWLEQLSMDVGAKHYQLSFVTFQALYVSNPDNLKMDDRRIKKSHAQTLGGISTEKIVSGTGEEDTYLKMLGSIKGLTRSIAEGIGRVYPSIRSLYEGYEKAGGDKERCEMLVGALVCCSIAF